ncbi:GNAT family N-acetyltransferase [Lacibacter sp.]|uniref:GNAT family N-acetyltransferase n=1 Tax=Lacibacter sp. TaxID=1915409 RepID=UPI002B4B620A|nr:GNAT family N-acetyltransferase [Lacibacter sp.]HLP37720.1 GNAT family N-acetyltransferase [Lacibacter sp.]
MNKQPFIIPELQEEELFHYLKKRTETLFGRTFDSSLSVIELRSLDLQKDLPTIYNWVHQPYAKKFWQMNIGLAELEAFYLSVLKRADTHSIVASYNNQLVAQIDLYHAPFDEVGKCYPATMNDYGLHFIMAPVSERIPSFSTIVFSAAVEFLFGFSCVHRVVGEPDSCNVKANELVQRAGFRFQQQIVLPDKVANLYFCDHSSFILPY